MSQALVSSFAVRLRDLLSTLEAASLVGGSDGRMRGIGEQLMFCCMAMPCDEAVVALERTQLGRLSIAGVADAQSWRPCDVELLASGTPFAYLLGGGTGYASEVEASDPLMEALQPILGSEPSHAIYVPVRVGTSVLGGAALFHSASLGDEQLVMAERLAEVLSLTVEAHRSERVLLRLFADALPDLCGPDAATSFATGLESYIHRLRLSPLYRDRLLLADQVARLASQGPDEAKLAADLLHRIDDYVSALTSGGDGDDAADAVDDLY